MMSYLQKNLSKALLFLHQLKHIEISTWEVNAHQALFKKNLQRQQR